MVIVFFVRPQNALSSLNYKLEVVWRQNGKKAGIQRTIKWRILRLSSKHKDLFLSSIVYWPVNEADRLHVNGKLVKLRVFMTKLEVLAVGNV